MWYRGIFLIRKCLTLGSYGRSMPRTLRKSWGRGAFSYERGTRVGWGNGQWLKSPFPSCNMGGDQVGLSTRWTTRGTFLDSEVIRDQICTTRGPQVNCVMQVDF